MLLRDKTRFIFSLLIQINVINFDIVAAALVGLRVQFRNAQGE